MMKKVSVLAIAIIMLTLSSCGGVTTKHTLTYLGGEVRTVSVHEQEYKLVCVYTEYTNSSGASALPADWVDVKAYQDGIEIPVIVFSGEKIDEYVQCDTSVRDGATTKVIWTFQPENESQVTVELSTGEEFTIGG